jgi:hypothetical protein
MHTFTQYALESTSCNTNHFDSTLLGLCCAGLPGDQSLGFALFSVCSGQLQALTAFQPLSMTPKSTLKWAGFSDEGTPFTLDSAGSIRMFSRQSYWLPVCDTQAHVCIPYFVQLIFTDNLIFIYVCGFFIC